jgi:hypothetical protein
MLAGFPLVCFYSKWATFLPSLYVFQAVFLVSDYESIGKYNRTVVCWVGLALAHLPISLAVFVLNKTSPFIASELTFDEFVTAAQLLWGRTGLLLIVLVKITALTTAQLGSVVNPRTHRLKCSLWKAGVTALSSCVCMSLPCLFESGVWVDSAVRQLSLCYVLSCFTKLSAN